MKRLNIINFTKSVENIHSDYFEVNHCTDMNDKYVIGLSTNDVVSFKPLKKKHYKMAIYKELESIEYDYSIWLWDMQSNHSYPMTIDRTELMNIARFTKYLNGVLKLADEGQFSGSSGNMIK